MFDEEYPGMCYQMFQTSDPVTFGQNLARPINFRLIGYTYHDYTAAAMARSYIKFNELRRLL